MNEKIYQSNVPTHELEPDDTISEFSVQDPQNDIPHNHETGGQVPTGPEQPAHRLFRDEVALDINGFEPLIEKFAEQIYAYVNHILGNHEDAQEITNLTFWHAYRWLKPGRSIEHPTPWLYKIATNNAFRRKHQMKRYGEQQYL